MPSGLAARHAVKEAASVSAFVVAGYSKHARLSGMESSRREALESEHTTSGVMGTLACAIHSRMDWPTSEMEGAQKSTAPRPTYPSASRSDMSVLPVPQAITALHRSWSAKAATMDSTALSWWGRRSCVTRSPAGAPSTKGVQSRLEEAIFCVSMSIAPDLSSMSARCLPGPAAEVMTMRSSTPLS